MFLFVSSEINLYKRTSTARPVLPAPEFFSPAVVDNSRAWNRMSQEQHIEHFPMTPIRQTVGKSVLFRLFILFKPSLDCFCCYRKGVAVVRVRPTQIETQFKQFFK